MPRILEKITRISAIVVQNAAFRGKRLQYKLLKERKRENRSTEDDISLAVFLFFGSLSIVGGHDELAAAFIILN